MSPVMSCPLALPRGSRPMPSARSDHDDDDCGRRRPQPADVTRDRGQPVAPGGELLRPELGREPDRVRALLPGHDEAALELGCELAPVALARLGNALAADLAAG